MKDLSQTDTACVDRVKGCPLLHCYYIQYFLTVSTVVNILPLLALLAQLAAKLLHLALERLVALQRRAVEAVPQPHAEQHPEPALRPVPVLHHQRYLQIIWRIV